MNLFFLRVPPEHHPPLPISAAGGSGRGWVVLWWSPAVRQDGRRGVAGGGVAADGGAVGWVLAMPGREWSGGSFVLPAGRLADGKSELDELKLCPF